jgi:DNA-binding response OmpR family regulator
MANQRRLTFLIVEPQPTQSGLSSRKLLMEAAGHNVITGYSGDEGLALFHRFPNVDAVVLHTELEGVKCHDFAAEVQKAQRGVRVIALAARIGAGGEACEGADRVVSSHDPRALLTLLEEFGVRPEIP